MKNKIQVIFPEQVMCNICKKNLSPGIEIFFIASSLNNKQGNPEYNALCKACCSIAMLVVPYIDQKTKKVKI